MDTRQRLAAYAAWAALSAAVAHAINAHVPEPYMVSSLSSSSSLPHLTR